jgi:hypothetical protein
MHAARQDIAASPFSFRAHFYAALQQENYRSIRSVNEFQIFALPASGIA